MLQNLDGFPAVQTAIRDWTMTAAGAIPADVRDRLFAAVDQLSPVDRAVKLMETIYANADTVNAATRQLGAQLAVFAASNGFHGLAVDSRGVRIMHAMMRTNGADPADFGLDAWPDASADPVPLAEYKPAVEPAAPLPAVSG